MDEKYVNEVNMEVGIGEELDYEANDNIEHEEEATDKIETNQHERIVTEVANSEGEKEGERVVNYIVPADRTTEQPEKKENTEEAQPNNVHEPLKPSADGDGNSDHEKKDEPKDAKVASGSSVCKPCNLVFENKKWLDRHNESGDHTHVIKGFNPGGGKYFCYLCWLGFEHSEMMLHHIKRSEHITRARRRGVSDVYIKPSGKLAEKPTPGSQPAKSDECVPHRSGSQSQKSHRHSSQAHKSHRPISGTSHRSRSPLRIRLSDYYEVSSVGHCDTSGARLRSLANGVHKSTRVAVNKPSDDKSSHRKSQHGSKPVVKVKNSIVEGKNESSARVPNPVNGTSNPEPEVVNLNKDYDLNSTKPPDVVEQVECVNQSNENGLSVTDAKDVESPTIDASSVPAAMET